MYYIHEIDTPATQISKHGQTQSNTLLPPTTTPSHHHHHPIRWSLRSRNRKRSSRRSKAKRPTRLAYLPLTRRLSATRYTLYALSSFKPARSSPLYFYPFLLISRHVSTVKRETQLGQASLLACTSASTVPPYTVTWACIYPSYGVFTTISCIMNLRAQTSASTTRPFPLPNHPPLTSIF